MIHISTCHAPYIIKYYIQLYNYEHSVSILARACGIDHCPEHGMVFLQSDDDS